MTQWALWREPGFLSRKKKINEQNSPSTSGLGKIREQQQHLPPTVVSILQLERDLLSSTAKMALLFSTNPPFKFSVPFLKTHPAGLSNLIKANSTSLASN